MGEKPQVTKAEKFKYILLAAVAVAMLAGSVLLFYQIQKQNSPTASSTSSDELKKEIEDLNKKIDDLSNQLKEAKNQSPTVETKTYSSFSSEGKVAGESTQKSGMVNINSASASELDSLPGIGPAYAQRIIEYRSANGGFKSIEEIKNIKGIGDKTFEKFKDQITI